MSQSTANELVRVLTGKPRKYTATFLMASGERLELQTDFVPQIQFSEALRALAVITKCGPGKEEYEAKTYTVMPWAGVVMMNVEQNPE